MFTTPSAQSRGTHETVRTCLEHRQSPAVWRIGAVACPFRSNRGRRRWSRWAAATGTPAPSRRSKRWSTGDIPPLAGRTAVVTGANTGLGLATARALAVRGAAVVLAVRVVGRGEMAAADIRASAPGSDVAIQELNLASLASIRDAAATLCDTHDRIDLLINNAGVMWTPRSITEDGFELQFGVNHLGHFAFTGLLLERLLSVPGSRVVTVSSVGHRFGARIDLENLDNTRKYDRVSAYTRSKLANLLFTYELQRRLAAAGAATSALAAHPGWSGTDLARHSPTAFRLVERIGRPLAQSPSFGAQPTLRAATDPAAVGGEFYGPGGVTQLWGHAARCPLEPGFPRRRASPWALGQVRSAHPSRPSPCEPSGQASTTGRGEVVGAASTSLGRRGVAWRAVRARP